MKIISLALGVSLKESPGSFGAHLEGDTLYLPVKVYICTQNLDWKGAAQLFLGTIDFPEAFQESLGWTAQECKQANEELGKLLRGHVPDDVFDLLQSEFHPKGARPPDTD